MKIPDFFVLSTVYILETMDIGHELDLQARSDPWTPKSGYLLNETVQYQNPDDNQWYKNGKVAVINAPSGTYNIADAHGKVYEGIPAKNVKAQPSATMSLTMVTDTELNMSISLPASETSGPGEELNVWVGFPGSYDKVEINMMTTSTVLDAKKQFAKVHQKLIK